MNTRATGSPAETPVTTRRRARAVRHRLRSYPVSSAFALVVAGASIATGSAWGADASAWGAGPLSTFASGRWWTLATALVVPDSAVDAALSVVLSLTALAWAERLLGHARALAAAVGVGVGGLLAASGLHAALWTVTELRPVEAAEVPVLDPAVAIVGAVMAATAFAPALWRRRVRLGGFGMLAMFALYAGDADAWYRLATAIVGLVVGVVLARGRTRQAWHRSSARESRTLLALVVAVSGVGPLVALIGGGGRGPLSLVVDAFSQYDADVVRRCATVELPQCDEQLTFVVTRGAGPALLAVVPLLLLLAAAWGLRRGRRAAWRWALGVDAALAVAAAASWASGGLVIDPWVDGTGLEYVLWSLASIGVPCAIVVSLLICRGRFPVVVTRRTARTYAIVVSAALVVAGGTLSLTGWLGRRDFSDEPTPAQLALVTLRRLIPQVFLQPTGRSPYPHHGPALFAYQWTGAAFWAVVLVTTLWLYRQSARPPDGDAAQYRALLRRGSDTLAYVGTWRGNRHWSSADGCDAVAYRVVGDVALALADPLAADGDRRRVLAAFAEHCVEHGWIPAFYSAHADTLAAAEALGWRGLPVGVETVMDLEGLDFAGKAWQKVRQPLARAEREGYAAVWARWRDLSVADSSQIVAIDEEWVADRALPELGFTLGGVDELDDPEVRLLLAVGPDGRIEAVTSWMPHWRDGRIAGWTLDYMRRRADGPNGIMEFLIASAALRLRDEGAHTLSLSGAPLADDPGASATEATPVRSLLRWLATVLEPVYGFASLFRFKSKFRPRHRPLYLVYRDPLELPLLGAAITRAYLPAASRSEVFALLRAIRGASPR